MKAKIKENNHKRFTFWTHSANVAIQCAIQLLILLGTFISVPTNDLDGWHWMGWTGFDGLHLNIQLEEKERERKPKERKWITWNVN